MDVRDSIRIVELPSGRSFDVGRSRWDGPLDGDELAYCHTAGIEVGYDPAQIGWVVLADDDAGTDVADDAIMGAIDDAAGDIATRFAPMLDDLGTGQLARSTVEDALRPELLEIGRRLLVDLPVDRADALHWLLVHGVARALDAAAPGRGPTPPTALDGTVTFRSWTTDDVAVHRSLLDDEQVWEHLPESAPTPYTDETSRALIEVGNARIGHDVAAVELDGRVVGQCLLRRELHTTSPAVAEVAYWLGRHFWGQGLMSRVLPMFVDRCFERHDVDILTAWIQPENAASVRVAERAGFRRDTFAREAELAGSTGRAGFGRWALHRTR